MMFILVWLLVGTSSADSVRAQNDPPCTIPNKTNLSVEDIFPCLSAKQKVGQLFLVTFQGNSAETNSDIARLIREQYIGGVVLKRENNNFTQGEEMLLKLKRLTSQLQNYAPVLSLSSLPPTRVPVTIPIAVPLLIGIQQEGDGAPYSELTQGVTPLPSAMAVGATWNPDNAKQVGKITGEELSSLGINLLLAPLLDLYNPVFSSQSDLGTRSFGTNPYWVGKMGTAYIQGVKEGSRERMAVIPRHFPGYGKSDRPSNTEIPTVNQSLDKLRQEDLVPFFAATNNISPTLNVDGFLLPHIRYDFDGSASVKTPPISLSPSQPNKLTELLDQPELRLWREKGVIVSDALGATAVKQFYDSSGNLFLHRNVAQDAFSAGNDLLFLAEFSLNSADGDYQQQLGNIEDTINWFAERYTANEAGFQSRVDQSSKRILELKLKLYKNNWSLQNIIYASIDNMPSNEGSAELFSAKDAITLLSSVTKYENLSPPVAGDNMVIFTDNRLDKYSAEPLISRRALQDRLLQLYGPSVTGQLNASQIKSFSFRELKDYLPFVTEEIPPPSSADMSVATPVVQASETLSSTVVPAVSPQARNYELQEALRSADWVLFAMLDVTPDIPESEVVRQFLAYRSQIATTNQKKFKIVAFAYSVPNLLDATEINQLDLYLGVYSKIPSFIDDSLRILFKNSSPQGRSPIDLPAMGYQISEITQPDPTQKIELNIFKDGILVPRLGGDDAIALSDSEEEADLTFTTSVIKDHFGLPVPDGTIVRFQDDDVSDNWLNNALEVKTKDGVATYERNNLTFDIFTPDGARVADDTIIRIYNPLFNVFNEVKTLNGVATYRFAKPSGLISIRVVAGEAKTSESILIKGDEAIIVSPTPLPSSTPLPPTITPTPTTPTPTPTVVPTSTPRPTPIPTPLPTPIPGVFVPFDNAQTFGGVMMGVFATFFITFLIGRQLLTTFADRFTFVLWGVLGGLILYNYVVLNLPGAALFGEANTMRSFLTLVIGGVAGMIVFAIDKAVFSDRS